MRLLPILLILGLGFLCESHGFGWNFWKIRSQVKNSLRERRQRLLGDSLGSAQLRVIIQPLDHFDPQIKTTFGQRYFVNSQYWNKPDGPVFLYIGGEGTLEQDEAESGTYIDMAKKYGALVFAVEHRFYGGSLNNDGLELENLRFLSSQQALADLASFHANVSKTYNLTKANKWVSFGGSYPGSLSAWFRVKYPHLVHAAVASSAPVRAVTDFQGYNDVVAKSLGNRLIQGSHKCVQMVRTAFQKLDELAKQKNLSQLASDFLSCKPLDGDMDVTQLASSLAEWFMGIVQYNNEGGLFNVDYICWKMTEGPDAYQNLINFNKLFTDTCFDYSRKDFVDHFKKTTYIGTTDSGDRQWLYQTCSEFGYCQTCDDDECIFSRYMTLQSNLDMCQSVFGLSATEVNDRVDFTNAYYGSDQPQGSRILFVNGLIDPCHSLSVLNNLSSTELAIVIPITAHCADMYSSPPWDPPALSEARQKISDQVGKWLTEDSNSRGKESQKSSLDEILRHSGQKL